MIWEDVVKNVRLAFEIAGYNFDDYDIDLKINRRLSTTLGRCQSKIINNKAIPYRIEFSEKLLNSATDKEIIDVIYHEAAHALVEIETQESHGHDAVFKAMCARIGTENDGRYTRIESFAEEAKNKVFKYDVVCAGCGSVSHYSRMCKTLKMLDRCTCKACGQSNFKLYQNY